MNFLKITDLNPEQIINILDKSLDFKKGYRTNSLKGKNIVLLFEKPSLRTKLGFFKAINMLGGHPVYFGPEEIGMGEREPIKDVSKVVSKMADVAILRTFSHSTLEEFSHYSNIPVVNALSDLEHPCQALGDLLTIKEFSSISLNNVKITFVGDGNNVARSLCHAILSLGGEFVICTPKEFGFDNKYITKANQLSKLYGGEFFIEHYPEKAVKNTNIIYTDVWASMGQEKEISKRKIIFKNFQVNEQLLSISPEAFLMHDLPAHHGEEISEGLLDHPQSIVFEQAENRVWSQVSLLNQIIL
ncbi:MAG: ornithine carbamoyltransferase [Dehalococcoidia bacterium]|jgi:ornithine carbamoyltransferase|nr:ornithine carbamoyltransferase [Dehalococcoidia bacterium]HJN58537.1 ornithine carbamoyltransferase [Dehalococcoidia bacterium]